MMIMNLLTYITMKSSLDDILMLPGRIQRKIMGIEAKIHLMMMNIILKITMMNEYHKNTQISYPKRKTETVAMYLLKMKVTMVYQYYHG